MADDYYDILGVKRTATPEEIQKAYRTVARKSHPDLNPDDKQAKQNFQKVQKAFETLNDPEKRKLYDQLGSDYEQFSGGGGPPPPGGGGGAWSGQMPPDLGGIDLGELFERFGFGGGGEQFESPPRGKTKTRRGRAVPQAGADLQHEVTIPFSTAVLGESLDLTLQRGGGKTETLSVKIPAGIADGGRIRLRGQGEPGSGGGPSGDLLLQVRVAPHPFFTRQGLDLEVRLPVTLAEAVQGAKVDVPIPGGTIALKIPSGTSSGKRLRVKGRGVKQGSGTVGDLYAVVEIQLPAVIPDALAKAVAALPAENSRGELRW